MVKIAIHSDTFHVEKEFNRICNEFNFLIKNKKPIPQKLKDELDKEFNKIKRIYESENNFINLYHVSHNYYIRCASFLLTKNFQESFYNYVKAFLYLLKRIRISRYNENKLGIMLKPYHSLIAQFKEIDDPSVKFSTTKIELFSDIHSILVDIHNELSENVYMILNGILSIYINKTYKHFVTKTVYELKELERLETIKGHLELIENIISLYPNGSPSIDAQINNFYYRIHKFRAFYFISKYDETGDEKHLEDIKKEISQMINSATLSYRKITKLEKLYLRQNKNPPHSIINMKIGYKIDEFFARYMFSMYVNFDFFGALKQLSNLQDFIVDCVFSKGIKINKEQLEYFNSEINLLKSFIKIVLLEIEIEKLKTSTTQKKVEELLTKLLEKLNESKSLYRYKKDEKISNYQLKIITKSFSGSLSEYLIHELFLDLNKLEIKEPVNTKLREIFLAIRDINPRKIERNFKFDRKKDKKWPDIDIFLDRENDPIAVFVKNGTIGGSDKKTINRELEYVSDHRIKKVYYFINMLQNIENINDMKSFFNSRVEKYPDIELTVIDLKILVTSIIEQFERNNYRKFNFSDTELLKLLNY